MVSVSIGRTSTIWVSRQFPQWTSNLADLADLVADSYDFNDHAYRRFVERIKVRFSMTDTAHADHMPGHARSSRNPVTWKARHLACKVSKVPRAAIMMEMVRPLRLIGGD